MNIELLRLNYARDWGGAPVMLRVAFIGRSSPESFEVKLKVAEGEDEVLLALLAEYVPLPVVFRRDQPVQEGVVLAENDLISISMKDVEQAVWRLWPESEFVIVGPRGCCIKVLTWLPPDPLKQFGGWEARS